MARQYSLECFDCHDVNMVVSEEGDYVNSGKYNSLKNGVKALARKTSPEVQKAMLALVASVENDYDKEMAERLERFIQRKGKNSPQWAKIRSLEASEIEMAIFEERTRR